MRRYLTSAHLPPHHRDATASHRPPSMAAFLALGPFGEALPLAARALQATSPDTFGPPVHRQNATGAPALGTTGSDYRRMARLSAHPVPVPAAGGEPNHADAQNIHYIVCSRAAPRYILTPNATYSYTEEFTSRSSATPLETWRSAGQLLWN